MKAAVDLHIHSALSPCADNDMTPNNIVNMALLKGLDIIAITDHNSSANIEALVKCGEKRNLIVVPGIEVETKEEIHILCLFEDVERAVRMGKIIAEALPKIKNRADILGEQLIINENDEVVSDCSDMLLTAAQLSTEEILSHVSCLKGIAIPAHVDRPSYSILSNLGVIPREYGIKCLELSKNCNFDIYKKINPDFRSYRHIRSSDAHSLGDILERENFIEIGDLTIKALFESLNGRY